MLDDENYTGLYLLDRDAERTLDSSERYGWSDFIIWHIITGI